MRKLFSFSIIGFISTSMLFLSCSNPQNSEQHEERVEEQDAPFDENATTPDSLQLDSINSDSVDHNNPESPRM